jgi:hypothetical protein
MNLSDEQKAALAGWVQSGMSLSDIQKLLESEFEIRMTYMDLRFLVDDLNLEVTAEGPVFETPKTDPADLKPGGEVSVNLDKVARPDALVSGQVTFSDGVTAQWSVDQMGRLALNPSQEGYQPSPEDLQEFQNKLQEAARKAGMF